MTPSDFIENESFRRWVFANAPDDAAYWKSYLEQHPDCRAGADLARTFLLTVKGELPDLTDQQVDQAVGRIVSTAPDHRPRLGVLPVWSFGLPLRVAASAVLLLATGWFGWQYWSPNRDTAPIAKTAVTVPAAVPLTELINRQSAPQLVRLTDGSLVLLQHNARIRFPKQFSGSKRDVFLTGNAFFEVVPDRDKPFRVFTRELTTEVLGTSFLINAPETGGINVVVKTGKVTVSTNPAFIGGKADSQPKTGRPQRTAVVLSPNQQATFSPTDARLVKSAVSRAAATVLPATTQAFAFRRTPLPVVLDALAKAYGIVIRYNSDELANCTLTARLDDPSLFARLDVITASTGSAYELQNGQLVIHSSGCR